MSALFRLALRDVDQTALDNKDPDMLRKSIHLASVSAAILIGLGSTLHYSSTTVAAPPVCAHCRDGASGGGGLFSSGDGSLVHGGGGLLGHGQYRGGNCRDREYGQPDIFQNYYAPGICGGVPAQLYVAPLPVPASVGHTYFTYQPLMPHELLYQHKRVYHRYYEGGRGLTRTSVHWR